MMNIETKVQQFHAGAQVTKVSFCCPVDDGTRYLDAILDGRVDKDHGCAGSCCGSGECF